MPINSYYQENYWDGPLAKDSRADILLVPEYYDHIVSPCSYIRVLLPYSIKDIKDKYRIRLARPENIYDIKAKIVISNRLFLKNLEDCNKFIKYINKNDIIFIYDLDDDLLALDQSHENYFEYKDKKNIINELINAANLVTVSTRKLADLVSKINQNVVVIENSYKIHENKNTESKGCPLNLLYMGTYTHKKDLEIVLPALEEINKNSIRCYLNIIGISTDIPSIPWIKKIPIPEEISSYPQFMAFLTVLKGLDLGIAPLVENKFNESKSAIKIWDYCLAGIPTLASNIAPYNELIQDNVNGLLANNTTSEWAGKLNLCIENPGILKNLYKKIYKSCNGYKCSNDRLRIIDELVNPNNVRWTISKRYIRGSGIEIGALHNPLKTNTGVQVRYVDRMDKQSLYMHYPELNELNLVNVDIVDDGENLYSIEDCSQDFVIANHFLEHSEDPIKTIMNLLRVLRRGGILYLSIPNKEMTFDSDRSLTSIEHLVSDNERGPLCSRKDHYREWVTLCMPCFGRVYTGDTIEKRTQELMDQKYSIHFHVWTIETFKSFLEFMKQRLSDEFDIRRLIDNNDEFIAILEKIVINKKVACIRNE